MSIFLWYSWFAVTTAAANHVIVLRKVFDTFLIKFPHHKANKEKVGVSIAIFIGTLIMAPVVFLYMLLDEEGLVAEITKAIKDSKF